MDIENFIKAVSAIKENHGKPESDVIDSMECPKCGGVLQYGVSSYNGHTRGKCDTENCLTWME